MMENVEMSEDHAMQIPILVEPMTGGGFRATIGEPFAAFAEGGSAEEATRALATAVKARIQPGARIAGLTVDEIDTSLAGPIHFDPVPEDDWFFRTMSEEIATDRRLEDEVIP
jgi:hypothetical protein